MSTGAVLSPDLRDAARRLMRDGRVRAEAEPDLYRNAINGRKELAAFFRRELGWPLDILEVARLVRLHKRRKDLPSDRGPRLWRDGRPGPLAPAVVMVVEMLICEQLWRRPRMSLRELLQAIAQVCAAESPAGRLPVFQLVASEGTAKKDAQQNRQHVVDALKLLVAESSITVDADLDRAVIDEETDLIVTGSRDRLNAKFSSLSPALLGLNDLPPEQHAAVLAADVMPDQVFGTDFSADAIVQGRRLAAMRRLVDDPAVDPFDEEGDGIPYLHSISGRERALTVAASLGLGVTARRDWWEVTDPSGQSSGVDFPNGRRSERQAALAVLAMLPRRQNPAASIAVEEIIAEFEKVRTTLPRWAAAYQDRLPALARAAVGELISVRLLRADPGHPDCWLPTPGIHLWRVRVRQSGGNAGPDTRHETRRNKEEIVSLLDALPATQPDEMPDCDTEARTT